MRGMAREYAAGNSLGPGWRESAGIFGCPVGGSPTVPSGREWNGSQPGQGAAELSQPKASDPEDAGSIRRAERVSRPAREKNRRRRVLVVAIRSPRPIRAVQRARLWAIVWTASQAPLAAKRPEGRWFSPTPYLRSWHSRSRRGGDGQPPVRATPRPGR